MSGHRRPRQGTDEEHTRSHRDRDHQGLVRADWWGTGAVVLVAVGGVAAPGRLGALTAVVSGALFVIGVAAFLYGYGAGIVRSRDEQVTLGGLFLLSHTAPRDVRIHMRAAFGGQLAAAVVAAAIRPYTAVAFVVLAPIYGLGLMAAWGARHGRFHPKEPTRGGSTGTTSGGGR